MLPVGRQVTILSHPGAAGAGRCARVWAGAAGAGRCEVPQVQTGATWCGPASPRGLREGRWQSRAGAAVAAGGRSAS
jgi:hypothetical protein